MSRLIDADALIADVTERYCKECNKRKGMKNGKLRTIYEIGEVPCRACDIDDMKDELDNAPTVDAVPVSTLEQIKWERDSFAEQIREIGGEPFAKWDAMDVVNVVRCKDCKYGEIDDPDFPDQYLCLYHGSDWNSGDHFCSYGEKVMK